MRHRILLPALLCPALAATTPEVPSAETNFGLIRRWAGSDAASMGFTQEKLLAFMAARAGDLGAGRQGSWSDWLKSLEPSRNPSLKAWALARRVESGDFGAYPAFQEALTEHVLGVSKPGSGRGDKIVTDPPRTSFFPMPGALRIDHDSPFWPALRKTIRATPDRKLDAGLYTIWCHGTHPDQRDLILEMAAQIQAPPTVNNPNPDPWNDPRFWIVTDWAMAWGMEDDFEAIRKALPEGTPKGSFDRVKHAVEGIPGFFSRPPEPGPAWIPPGPIPKQPDPSGDAPVTFDFSQIKILEQPSPPRYPEEAKRRKMMTHLVMEIVVDPQGVPTSCRPAPGPWLGFFAPTGATYGMRWRFRPPELNGVPMHARFRLTMPFRLRN